MTLDNAYSTNLVFRSVLTLVLACTTSHCASDARTSWKCSFILYARVRSYSVPCLSFCVNEREEPTKNPPFPRILIIKSNYAPAFFTLATPLPTPGGREARLRGTRTKGVPGDLPVRPERVIVYEEPRVAPEAYSTNHGRLSLE